MLKIFKAIENLVAPEFDGNHNGADLTRAFRLLVRAVIIFGFAIALWSLAAGVLEAGKWTGGTLQEERYEYWRGYPYWALLLAGSFFLGAKLLGALSLIAMAAGLVGGFLGFLFGLPSRPAGAQAATDQPDKADGASRAVAGWIPSTNLIQITDWLTKIIVGVGLVEAKKVFEIFTAMSATASQQLLGGAFGSGLVVPAVILGALVLGFKICNLYTLLFLARLIAEAGNTISGLTPKQEKAVNVLNQLSPSSPVIAGPIEPAPAPGNSQLPKEDTPPATPTDEQREAAVEIGGQPLDKLNTSDTVLAWSRGKAVLDRYQEAAAGYRKLREIAGFLNWDVLGESARVYASAGLDKDAREALGKARASASQEPPSKQVSVVRDQVILLLYDDPPQGYTRALAMLDDSMVDADASGELALFRACALGQKYRHEKATLSSDEKNKILQQAFRDVKTALERGQSKSWIRLLSDPNYPDKERIDPANREDDLEPFSDDQEFRKLVGLAPLDKPAGA